jgi:hypothetical protein
VATSMSTMRSTTSSGGTSGVLLRRAMLGAAPGIGGAGGRRPLSPVRDRADTTTRGAPVG